MTLVRRIVAVAALLVAAVAAPLSVSGFWADGALSDSDGFAARMQSAWADEALQEELAGLMTEAAQERIYAYFGVDGPGGSFLADAAVPFARGSINSALSSQEFATAWGDWQRALHADLATIVTGGQPATTAVDGRMLTVDVTPLVSGVLAGPVGGFALRFLGEDVLVQQIDTGYDIGAQLQSFGDLWRARWWAAGATVAAVAVATLAWLPRPRGLALALAAAAAGCTAAGVWRLLPGSTEGPEPSLLSGAIAEALVGGWPTWLFLAAALFAVAAGALFAVGRRGPGGS